MSYPGRGQRIPSAFTPSLNMCFLRMGWTVKAP